MHVYATMAAMHVRRGTDADAHAAATVAERVLREHGLPFDPLGADADLLRPEASFHSFFVAVDGDRVVGTAALAVHDDGCGELRKLFLLSDCRGAGVGRGLLDAVLDAARSAGLRQVRLLTRDRYDRAIRLYERSGFRPDGAGRHRRDGGLGPAYVVDLAPTPACTVA
ncbi:MAG TPA: GNAT family N-acetyltransferase [Acidimicrobiales bacterium]|jgi:putative acetyltransferase